MIEVDFNEYEDAWPWWKPGYHKAHFCGGYFKRVWWMCFAVAWVRLNLHDYNRYIESGRSEWRFPRPSNGRGKPFSTAQQD